VGHEPIVPRAERGQMSWRRSRVMGRAGTTWASRSRRPTVSSWSFPGIPGACGPSRVLRCRLIPGVAQGAPGAAGRVPPVGRRHSRAGPQRGGATGAGTERVGHGVGAARPVQRLLADHPHDDQVGPAAGADPDDAG
jgi:hypothetical protein